MASLHADGELQPVQSAFGPWSEDHVSILISSTFRGQVRVYGDSNIVGFHPINFLITSVPSVRKDGYQRSAHRSLVCTQSGVRGFQWRPARPHALRQPDLFRALSAPTILRHCLSNCPLSFPHEAHFILGDICAELGLPAVPAGSGLQGFLAPSGSAYESGYSYARLYRHLQGQPCCFRERKHSQEEHKEKHFENPLQPVPLRLGSANCLLRAPANIKQAQILRSFR